MQLKKQVKRLNTGAFALIDSLVRNGTKEIFGYPGGAILPIYDEMFLWEKNSLITHKLVRHEQGAAHAADAYARATGKVGVCFATSGPGATNLVTGIATAYVDSVPMVVITAQVATSFIGTDAFQEIDTFGITIPIVKHSYMVKNAKDILNIVSEAYFLAKNGRPGPVLIDIPKDVGLDEIYDYKPIYNQKFTTKKLNRSLFETNLHQLRIVLNFIDQASQPLLYVGGGTIISDARDELLTLAEKFQIPVTTTLMGKGSFNENHPLCLGMLGMHGTAYANFAISECDLLIAIGARFDDRVTGKLEDFASQAQIVHIDIDPAEIGKNKIPNLAILGDIKKVLQELLKLSINETRSEKNQTRFWLERIEKWKKTYPLIIPQIKDHLSPQQVISKIATLVPDAYFTTDVGQHQMWSAQFLKVEKRKWLSSAGLGTMGYRLPAAIGAQVAFPESKVICISGDASIQMNIQELGTIAQYNLPIKLIILNNKWQGMVRQWQQSYYEERYAHSSMTEGMPDFVALANSYGIKGFNITTFDELIEKKDEIFSQDEPIVVNFAIEERENCYPMVQPGKSNSQMIGLNRELE